MFEPGYSQSAELRVPNKYAMTFRLKCAAGCWTREPPYKFLVDVGVGNDVHAWWDKEDPKKRPITRPPMP
jgi:murein endopeptidase